MWFCSLIGIPFYYSKPIQPFFSLHQCIIETVIATFHFYFYPQSLVEQHSNSTSEVFAPTPRTWHRVEHHFNIKMTPLLISDKRRWPSDMQTLLASKDVGSDHPNLALGPEPPPVNLLLCALPQRLSDILPCGHNT